MKDDRLITENENSWDKDTRKLQKMPKNTAKMKDCLNTDRNAEEKEKVERKQPVLVMLQ